MTSTPDVVAHAPDWQASPSRPNAFVRTSISHRFPLDILIKAGMSRRKQLDKGIDGACKSTSCRLMSGRNSKSHPRDASQLECSDLRNSLPRVNTARAMRYGSGRSKYYRGNAGRKGICRPVGAEQSTFSPPTCTKVSADTLVQLQSLSASGLIKSHRDQVEALAMRARPILLVHGRMARHGTDNTGSANAGHEFTDTTGSD